MATSSIDASGILLRPPAARGPSSGGRGRRRGRALALAVLVLAVLVGGTVGVITGIGALRPRRAPPPAPAPAASAPAAPACDAVEAQLADARARLATAEAELTKARARDRELAAAAEAATAARATLAGAVGGQGEVSQRGDEITLELVDKVLFRVGEATLTPHGQEVLAAVGAALNDVPDKQIWVQGHTDDSPIRAGGGVAARFASNWELASARALTVVHYLQDQAKVDPRRLAAVAFGQYRPAGRQKARNRRIEIVLYPTHQLAR